MARIIILGSAAAVNDAEHDYTHFIIEGESGPILIDCGSNPLGKIHKLGINDNSLQDMILTHFHPDRASGVPNMFMHMWLLGRKSPLRIYGLNHCVNRVEDMMMFFSWDSWPNFFPVTFHRILERGNAPLLENDNFIITSWPTKNFISTIGLRIVNKRTGNVLAYSCDTEPIPALLELGHDADMLIHEAAGKGSGIRARGRRRNRVRVPRQVALPDPLSGLEHRPDAAGRGSAGSLRRADCICAKTSTNTSS